MIASRAAARGLPLWKRAQLYTGRAGALRLAGGVLRTAMDFPPIFNPRQIPTGEATPSPLRSVQSKRPLDVLHPCAGLRQLPLCGLAARKHLALQAAPSRQVLQNLSIL